MLTNGRRSLQGLLVILFLIVSVQSSYSENVGSLSVGQSFTINLESDSPLTIEVLSLSSGRLDGTISVYPWFAYKFRWLQFVDGTVSANYDTDSGTITEINIRGNIEFGRGCTSFGLTSPTYPLRAVGSLKLTEYENEWMAQYSTDEDFPPGLAALDVVAFTQCLSRGVEEEFLSLIQGFEKGSEQAVDFLVWSREFGHPGINYPELPGYPSSDQNTAADPSFPIVTFPLSIASRQVQLLQSRLLYTCF